MPQFARRHYETLAACIREQRAAAIRENRDLRSLEMLASAITLELQLDNPRFNRERFENACKPKTETV